MTDRNRTPASLPAIAAALLLLSASSAWAEAPASGQTSAPSTAAPTSPRHLDVEVGVGAHIGIKNDAPVDDDLYADIGLAAPISNHFDAEFQAGYLTGSDNDDDDDPNNPRPDNKRNSRWLINAGVRCYPLSMPDSTARFFVASGATLMVNYEERDDTALGLTIGPGVRLRAGTRSGLLVRVPVTFGVEHDSHAIIIPSLSYFFQF